MDSVRELSKGSGEVEDTDSARESSEDVEVTDSVRELSEEAEDTDRLLMDLVA